MSSCITLATLIGIAVISLSISGCSTEIAGMKAPVQHDYDVVDWLPLTGTVRQPFIVTSGYTAAVQNDPDTAPQDLIEQLKTLPAAATSGRLSELRLGVRPLDGEGRETSLDGTLSIYSTSDLKDLLEGEELNYGERENHLTLVYQANLVDLPRDGDQLVIRELPDLPPGSLGVVELVPEGEAPAWEFGLSRWRAPYGGWKADSDEELSGAMLFETIYDQPVDSSGIVASGVSTIQGGLNRDAGFLVAWFFLLLTVGIAGLAFVSLPSRRRSAG